MERIMPKHKIGLDGLFDLRVRRSRDGLRTALLQLLETQAFDDITVREIAGQADVGYTTFFRHFASKEALLDAVIRVEIEQLTDRSQPIDLAADGAGACLALCEYIDQHRPLWTGLLTGGAASKVREEMMRQSHAIKQASTQEQGLPLDLGIALAVSGIVELLCWWLRQPKPWDARRIAPILYERIILPATKSTA
jgi:AcrR family transcriptional regulator